jgi:hypothetical protein
MKRKFHDDSCGEFLLPYGLCPVCGFHPDAQSVGLKEDPNELGRVAFEAHSASLTRSGVTGMVPWERLSVDTQETWSAVYHACTDPIRDHRDAIVNELTKHGDLADLIKEGTAWWANEFRRKTKSG